MVAWVVVGAIGLGLGLGCGRGAAKAAAPMTCRKVALAADRWVAAAAPAEREAMLRVAVELIDLCQGPGLAPATRTCVAAAATADDVRACPALALVPLRAATPVSRGPDEGEGEGEGELGDVLESDPP